MSRPNFLIVGAPKAGTTALSRYLGEHPHVFMTTPKEPHYLATDLQGYRQATSLADYERLFAGANHQQWRRGEASVFYLYSRCAAKQAQQYFADARIIVMLRNPVDLVESLHAQLLYSRDEDQTDFRTAWKLCACRKSGHRVPARCRDAKVLLYDEIAKLGEQVERWQRYFPRNHIKFVVFDDLVADAAEVYRDVLGFLELPDDGRTSFQIVNARKSHRISLVANFTERTPAWLVAAARRAKQLLGIERWGILDLLRRWNRQDGEPTSMRRSLRAEIRATYAEDVQRLSDLIDRDLDHWIHPHSYGSDSEMGPRCVEMA